MIKIKIGKDLKSLNNNLISRQFSNFFNSYSKSINKAYHRSGSLFEKPFKRKLIDKDNYLTHLIFYIHNNPVKHGFVDKLSNYPFSSYNIILSNSKTNLKRNEVLDWFSGEIDFKNYHLKGNDINIIDNYIIE